MTSPQADSATKAEGAQAAQVGLMLLLAHELAQLWARVDPLNLKSTLPSFKAAVALLVQKYGKASMSLAANYYLNERRDAGVQGSYRVSLAKPAGAQQVSANVDYATRGLWTATPATEPDELANLIGAAQVQMQGSAEKMAQDPARETTLNAVRDDRQARGWARIPEPEASKSGTCAFCALLAIRGPVYRSEKAAGFKAHDGCKCHPQPIFKGQTYVPSGAVLDWEQTYIDSTKGLSGRRSRIAFRQALEGRPPPQ